MVYADKKGNVKEFGFEDLSKIIVYMAPSWHRGSSFRILPFEEYHYARIITKKGEEIIITCLIANHVWDTVREITGVEIELKQRFFASILLR